MRIRLGTRASTLALAQAALVAARLREAGAEVETVRVRTAGDERGGRSPAAGDKARFVTELEQALLGVRIDLAVHSAKDVPAQLAPELAIAAVPARADARDTLCGAPAIAALPAGARVGTASARRRALALALRPDLRVTELRGNVDTRLRKLAAGEADALLLAQAGLDRLGRGGEGAPVALEELVPAAGQGCLLLEARREDAGTLALAQRLTDPAALAALTAERALVAALGAGCDTPVGAHARLQDGRLAIDAIVALPDGSTWIRDALEGDPARPAQAGARLAGRMLAAGAAEVLDAAAAAAAG